MLFRVHTVYAIIWKGYSEYITTLSWYKMCMNPNFMCSKNNRARVGSLQRFLTYFVGNRHRCLQRGCQFVSVKEWSDKTIRPRRHVTKFDNIIPLLCFPVAKCLRQEQNSLWKLIRGQPPSIYHPPCPPAPKTSTELAWPGPGSHGAPVFVALSQLFEPSLNHTRLLSPARLANLTKAFRHE